MQLFVCQCGSVKRGGHGRLCSLCYAMLEPDLIGLVALPMSEERDAVGCAHDVCQMRFERVEREIFVENLRYFKAGLHIDGEMGDDADGSERDDCAGEGFGSFCARSSAG